MVAPARHARDALIERLRQARKGARLTGADLARQLGAGWAQPKVSKIESGRQLPTEDEIHAWAAATETDVRELLSFLTRAQHEHISFQDTFEQDGGAAQFQDAIGQAEQAATFVAGYQPTVIHGLLQSAEYARQMLHLPGGPIDNGASEDDIDQLVAARLRRQAILYEPGRTITLIMSEAALHIRMADDTTMRAQHEHLARLATTTRATIGIVPFQTPMPAMLVHAWDQRGEVIIVETTAAGDFEIADPAEVAKYEHYIQLLASVAAVGQEAARLIRAI